MELPRPCILFSPVLAKRPASLSMWRHLPSFRGDHREEVAVGVAEEKPLGRGRPQRLDQFGPLLSQALFQAGAAAGWTGHCDVPAVLALEGRWLEVRNLHQVKLLP